MAAAVRRLPLTRRAFVQGASLAGLGLRTRLRSSAAGCRLCCQSVW